MQAREVVRGVLLDPSGRVLLFQIVDGSGQRAWALPGGAVEPGEDDASALRRELDEELEIEGASVGKLVAEWELPFTRNGESALWRTRAYAVGRAEVPTLPEFARWWSRAELLESDEQFVPARLGAILADLL